MKSMKGTKGHEEVQLLKTDRTDWADQNGSSMAQSKSTGA
jgi:hypothetical protein